MAAEEGGDVFGHASRMQVGLWVCEGVVEGRKVMEVAKIEEKRRL